MAHFAQLDDDGIVTQIIVISNADIVDESGEENELIGISVCRKITGHKKWVQTSYNGNFRKKYASIGDVYDVSADVFYNPVPPYPSWHLDDNYDWQPPLPMPEDGGSYQWDENSGSWFEIPESEE